MAEAIDVGGMAAWGPPFDEFGFVTKSLPTRRQLEWRTPEYSSTVGTRGFRSLGEYTGLVLLTEQAHLIRAESAGSRLSDMAEPFAALLRWPAHAELRVVQAEKPRSGEQNRTHQPRSKADAQAQDWACLLRTRSDGTSSSSSRLKGWFSRYMPLSSVPVVTPTHGPISDDGVTDPQETMRLCRRPADGRRNVDHPQHTSRTRVP